MTAKKGVAPNKGAKKKKGTKGKRGFATGRHRVHPRTKPKVWIKWVLAARDIMLGATIQEAAANVAVSGRALGYWKASPEWADAEDEAEKLCVRGVRHKAMRVVDSSLTGRANPVFALDVLKSTSKDFQPVSKHEVTGKDGKPIQHATKVTFYMPENGR